MFLSLKVPQIVLAIMIPIILLQYGFAIFCLLKLAYLDINKKEYALWNLLILTVFFIGGAVFLAYYGKHPEKRIQPDAVPKVDIAQGQPEPDTEFSDNPE